MEPNALPKLEGPLPEKFEDALEELSQIVRSLESGQVPLEESIKAYERGMALKKVCEDRLKNAQMRVQKLVEGENGDMEATPL